jgi:hypothetical protein
MGHSILFDYHDWLYVGLFSCDRDVGGGTRGEVPCPKGKEKQADSFQAIYLFFFFYFVGKPDWDN